MLLYVLIAPISAIPLSSMQGLGSNENEYNSAVADIAKRKESEEDPLWEGNSINNINYI